MRIQTSRFGAVELTEEDILTFPEGLLGFTNLREFVLLDDPNDEIFAWLQSCENSGIAFPILEPELFAGNYQVELSRVDLQVIEASKDQPLRYFTIVTIPEDPTQMTANLKAPVVVNVRSRKARQCVLQDNNLAIREPIFAKLQQRVVQNPSLPIKIKDDDLRLTVRLPGPNRTAEVEA